MHNHRRLRVTGTHPFADYLSVLFREGRFKIYLGETNMVSIRQGAFGDHQDVFDDYGNKGAVPK